jgi:superfamily II RNA helicase
MIEHSLGIKETDYAKRSMIQYDINKQLNCIKRDIDTVNVEIDKINVALDHLTKKVPDHVLKEYLDLKLKLPSTVNKKRKETERAICNLEDEYKNIAKDVETYKRFLEKDLEIKKLTNHFIGVEQYLDNNVLNVLNILEKHEFLKKQEDTSDYDMLLKGLVASRFKEVPCLIFANLIINKSFDNLSANEMIGILSCFTNVKVSDEIKSIIPVSSNSKAVHLLKEINSMATMFYDLESKNGVNTGTDYSIIFDLTDYMIQWANCESEPDCKFLLQQMSGEKDIFLGEFVKAILKINAIVVELTGVAELIGDMALLQKCKEVPQLTLKFVATNQSLYV